MSRVNLGLFRDNSAQKQNSAGMPPDHLEVHQQKFASRARDFLRKMQFLEADPHGAVIETRLGAHAPAQIDRLKLKATNCAVLFQLRDHVSLQGVTFMLQIGEERRADKDANDGPAADHGVILGRHGFVARKEGTKMCVTVVARVNGTS
jgi:hypothetical protein